MPIIWHGTMFDDLDGPLNASRGVSAIAEFIVVTEFRTEQRPYCHRRMCPVIVTYNLTALYVIAITVKAIIVKHKRPQQIVRLSE